MKTMTERLLPMLALASIGGATAWHYATNGPIAHAGLGLDPSASVEKNCTALRNSAQKYLKDKRNIREGSQFAILSMGVSARNPEPDVRLRAPIPIPSDNVFGRDGEAFRKQEMEFFDQIEATCASAKATRNSPIYTLVVRGIGHLRSLGCKPEGTCYYLLKTDLVDDTHGELRSVIEQSITAPDVALPGSLAGSIDNAGIQIHVCGTSEVRPRRENGHPAPSPDTLIRLWGQLFTNPEIVTFSPYCGQ